MYFKNAKLWQQIAYLSENVYVQLPFLSSPVLELDMLYVPIKIGLQYKCPINHTSWQGKKKRRKEGRQEKYHQMLQHFKLVLTLGVTYISHFIRNDIVLWICGKWWISAWLALNTFYFNWCHFISGKKMGGWHMLHQDKCWASVKHKDRCLAFHQYWVLREVITKCRIGTRIHPVTE